MIVVMLTLLALSTAAIAITVRSVFADQSSHPPRSRLQDPQFRPPAEPDVSADSRQRTYGEAA